MLHPSASLVLIASKPAQRLRAKRGAAERAHSQACARQANGSARRVTHDSRFITHDCIVLHQLIRKGKENVTDIARRP